MYSHILWDFNGTILNDVAAGINSANVLLKRRNIHILKDIADYHKYFCFPITEYYKKLGLDLHKENFHDIAMEWLEQYLYFSKSSMLYDGIRETLSKIKGFQIPQIILSATEKCMLNKQLADLTILDYFDAILGLDDVHAASKIEIAKQWKKSVNPENAILIGDTVHDYEVAKAIQIDCLLIANGHQSKSTLLTCGVPVFDDIKLIDIL